MKISLKQVSDVNINNPISNDFLYFNGGASKWENIAASNLVSLAGLAYASTAFVKMTGANTFTLDTSTYLTTVTAHNLLSTTHGDTLTDTVVRGDVMVGNATPKWSRLAKGTSGYFFMSNATDVAWTQQNELAALQALADTAGFLKKTGDGTYSIDTNTYLTTVTAHNLLSATHGDTTTGSAVLGDIIYADATPKWTKLTGNITLTKKVLTQTGTGTISAVPTWDTLSYSDVDAQQANTNLTSLAGLTYASTSFVKMTAAGTFALDTNVYLTSVTAHNLLSATHGDTLAGTVVRGDVMIGNATPKWSRLARGTNGYFFMSTSTDVAWTQQNELAAIQALADTAGFLKKTGGGAYSIDTNTYQASSTNLSSLAGLTYASTAFVKMTGANTFTLDTNMYLTTVTAHNLLSATHDDTLADTVVAGDLMIGNATPKWSRLAKGTAYQHMRMKSDASIPEWATVQGTVTIPLGTFATSGTATAGYALLGNELTFRVAGTNGQTYTAYAEFTVPANYASGGSMNFSVQRASTVTTWTVTAYVNNVVDATISAVSISPTSTGAWELKSSNFGSTLAADNHIQIVVNYTVTDATNYCYMRAEYFNYSQL